jgi:L-2-amino-thiazoline-4-carboxylic acid hydrolase
MRLPMSGETTRLTLLQQREIEARIVGPVVRAFAAEVGQEKALEILGRVIGELARQGGADLARRLGEQSLEAFARTLDLWRENGALELEVIEQSADRLSFNVVRCRYAEMYRALGMADLGASLSCQRDFALAEGFNSNIELTRTQTLMGGASYCDFRFRQTATEVPEAGVPGMEASMSDPEEGGKTNASVASIRPARSDHPGS